MLLGRLPKARAYLSDGQLEADNNICERSIRPDRFRVAKTTSSWAPKVAAKPQLSPTP